MKIRSMKIQAMKSRATRRNIPSSLMGAVLLCGMAAAPAFAGPAHAVLTIKPGATVPDSLPRQLLQLKESGEISNLLWINNAGQDNVGFSSMVVVDFATQGSYRRWLQRQARSLGTGVSIKAADVLVQDPQFADKAEDAVLKVSVYQPSVTPQHYASYATNYIAPLMQAQRDIGAISGYAVYLEHAATATDPGQAVLVTAYADTHSLARSTRVKETVRARLDAQDPTYARMTQERSQVRSKVSETLATSARLQSAR
jgi:hypothetical protein